MGYGCCLGYGCCPELECLLVGCCSSGIEWVMVAAWELVAAILLGYGCARLLGYGRCQTTGYGYCQTTGLWSLPDY